MEQMGVKPQRNGLIDIMRLIFAGIVMMYHFYSDRKHFPAGRFGVEFFVILAGFLMFAAYEHSRAAGLSAEDHRSIWLNYVKRRYIRFFWYSLIAFAAAFLVVRIWLGKLSGAANICDKLSGDIWEVLLVKMFGINRGKSLLNVPAWTLGCMLFSEFAILGVLTYWRRPFLSLWMPISVIFGTGYWINLESTNHASFLQFFTFGMLRVYLLTCFGVISYFIYKRLRRITFSQMGRGILTVLELLGYMLCIAITCYKDTRHYQFCFILIAVLTLAASFSRKSFAGSRLPANKLTNFCAEFSLSLYLIHWPVLKAFRHFYPELNDLYRQKFVFLFCALAAALAYTYVMRGVFKMLPTVKQKIKSIMLEQA